MARICFKIVRLAIVSYLSIVGKVTRLNEAKSGQLCLMDTELFIPGGKLAEA
jgi:hypothetical protein